MFYSKVSLLTLFIQHLNLVGCQHVSHHGISNFAVWQKLALRAAFGMTLSASLKLDVLKATSVGGE